MYISNATGCSSIWGGTASIQLSRSLVRTSDLSDALDQVLTDGLLAQIQAQTALSWRRLLPLAAPSPLRS